MNTEEYMTLLESLDLDEESIKLYLSINPPNDLDGELERLLEELTELARI